MIGIFIGSFNPPTLAHLKISLLAKDYYKKIVFVPVNSREKKLINISQRIDMLTIYQRKYSFIEIDNIMKNYSYLNYRIIDMLKKKYQSIELIIGSDLLEKLDSFDEYNYLLKNYYFLVITRYSEDVFKIIQRKYAKYINHFKIIEFKSDISSSLVREKLVNHDNLEGMIDEDILEYIKSNHLYV